MAIINLHNYLEKTELRIINWIAKNHFKVVSFLVPSGLLLFLSKLPYFNLFIRGSLVYILIAILALFIFKVSVKYIVTLATFTLIGSCLFLLLKLQIPAIRLFDFTFGMFVVAFIKFIALV